MPATLPPALVKALADAGFVALPVSDITPAKSAPKAKAKAQSPFIAALAEKRDAKLTAGTHVACPNCGRTMRAERTVKRDDVVVCKECYHADKREFAARHARLVKRSK
jgi:predicted RNA-binding Zn-ribbon protein involved in translation (DUF1610 family)